MTDYPPPTPGPHPTPSGTAPTWQWGYPAAPGTGWGPPSPPPGQPGNKRLWIVAAVLGGIALLAATIVVWSAFVGRFLAVPFSWDGFDEWTIPVGPDSDLETLELPVGACATTDDPFAPRVVEQVDCAQRHDFEFYLTDVLAVDAGITVADAGADVCEPAFATFVGAAYSRSEYDYLAFVPDDVRFARGDRDVTCAIRTLDGSDLEGSVKASRR